MISSGSESKVMMLEFKPKSWESSDQNVNCCPLPTQPPFEHIIPNRANVPRGQADATQSRMEWEL